MPHRIHSLNPSYPQLSTFRDPSIAQICLTAMASAASAACILNSVAAARAAESFRNAHCASAATAFPFHGAALGLGSLLPSPKASRITELRAPSRTVTMATGESSESTTTSDLIKSVQEAWEKTDDKLAIGGLGFAALIVLWASTGLISAIDKLPIIPTVFELVGLLFTGWFIYRYLLFKPDREELLKIIDDTKGKITGSKAE